MGHGEWESDKGVYSLWCYLLLLRIEEGLSGHRNAVQRGEHILDDDMDTSSASIMWEITCSNASIHQSLDMMGVERDSG